MTNCDRRTWLKAVSWGLLGGSASGWLPALAEGLATDPRRKRHCILLWMTGGPSQTDTFDMKPSHANGGEFQEIATNVAGLRLSEHLPQLAKQADKLALVRGLSTKEGRPRAGHPLDAHRPRTPGSGALPGHRSVAVEGVGPNRAAGLRLCEHCSVSGV